MVRIRLRRVGARNQASFRIVAADKRSPRDGRFLAILGHYNPRTEPATILIEEDQLFEWLGNGAQPSESVLQILKTHGTWDRWQRYRAGEDLQTLLNEAEESAVEVDPRTRRDDVEGRKPSKKARAKAEAEAAAESAPEAEMMDEEPEQQVEQGPPEQVEEPELEPETPQAEQDEEPEVAAAGMGEKPEDEPLAEGGSEGADEEHADAPDQDPPEGDSESVEADAPDEGEEAADSADEAQADEEEESPG